MLRTARHGLVGCLFLITLGWRDASAQRGSMDGAGSGVPALGVRGGYDFGVDAWAAGLRLRIPLGRVAFVIPSADYYFVTGAQTWQANLDLIFRGPRPQPIYGGLGGAVARRPFSRLNVEFIGEQTKLAFNLFVGLSPPLRAGAVRSYIEYRQTFPNDVDSYGLLSVGFSVPVGRRSTMPDLRRGR